MKTILINHDHMYSLLEIKKSLILEVVCGGSAMYDRRLKLLPREVERFRAEGEAFLTELAHDIAKNESHYAERFVK